MDKMKKTKTRLLIMALVGIVGAIFCSILIIDGSLLAVLAAVTCVTVTAMGMQGYDDLEEEESARVRAAQDQDSEEEE